MPLTTLPPILPLVTEGNACGMRKLRIDFQFSFSSFLSDFSHGGSSSNKGFIFCFKLSTKDYGLSTAYGEIGNAQCWIINIANGRKCFMPLPLEI
jgi:hypothetical protein